MEIETRIAGDKRVRVPRYVRRIGASREKLVIAALSGSQHKRTGHDLLPVPALELLNARAAVRRFAGVGYSHHLEPGLWGGAIGANPIIRDVGPPRARLDAVFRQSEPFIVEKTASSDRLRSWQPPVPRREDSAATAIGARRRRAPLVNESIPVTLRQAAIGEVLPQNLEGPKQAQ